MEKREATSTLRPHHEEWMKDQNESSIAHEDILAFQPLESQIDSSSDKNSINWRQRDSHFANETLYREYI